jgi:hypothetical protein
VKRSGRDEPMWVAIHKCMEATLRISLHSCCLYLKLAKTLCLSHYLLCFQQNQRRRAQNRFCPEAGEGGGEVAQTIYTHMSKCKNDKIKKRITTDFISKIFWIYYLSLAVLLAEYNIHSLLLMSSPVCILTQNENDLLANNDVFLRHHNILKDM